VTTELNKQKQTIAAEFNWLDLVVENKTLDDREKDRMKTLAKDLEKMWAIDDIRARQRAIDRNIFRVIIFSCCSQP
jgi:hypothetical protein